LRKIPVMTQSPRPYTAESAGYRFRLEPEQVAVLRALPDFDACEEPAVAEEFLRTRVESWADALSAASAAKGEYDVRLDAHQKRALLFRARELVFAAEI
jgi:hypothetical protein